MDLKKVRQIVSLLQEHPTIAELEVRNMRGFEKILIRRSPPIIPESQTQATVVLARPTFFITAPDVGWYLAAADLEKNPPLTKGSFVSQGEIVGYIENHGIRNEVVAEFAGTVMHVHAETGKPVEYDQKLYTILLSEPSRC
jgi:biotin carboxyl carrier protein